MKQLLIATNNPAKLRELKRCFASLEEKGIKVLSLSDLKNTPEPEETGKTFEENSLLKAKYYAEMSGFPTIADDGGIRIDALNGEPGVKSKRWLGRDATDEELIEYTLKRMKGIPSDKRTARMETVLTFYDPATKQSISETGRVEGSIALTPTSVYKHGYPYRALFVVKALKKYYDELSEKEHEDYNHRFDAARRLMEKIKIYLLQ